MGARRLSGLTETHSRALTHGANVHAPCVALTRTHTYAQCEHTHSMLRTLPRTHTHTHTRTHAQRNVHRPPEKDQAAATKCLQARWRAAASPALSAAWRAPPRPIRHLHRRQHPLINCARVARRRLAARRLGAAAAVPDGASPRASHRLRTS